MRGVEEDTEGDSENGGEEDNEEDDEEAGEEGLEVEYVVRGVDEERVVEEGGEGVSENGDQLWICPEERGEYDGGV